MSETKEIEFFVMIDEQGEFVVDQDADNVMTKYRDEVAECGPETSRVFHLKLTLPLPKPTVVQGTIPDTDGPINITIS